MEEREQRYVPVIVQFEADGKLRPLEIEFVDEILDVRPAACQSIGGVGELLYLPYPVKGILSVSVVGKEPLVCSRQSVTELRHFSSHSKEARGIFKCTSQGRKIPIPLSSEVCEMERYNLSTFQKGKSLETYVSRLFPPIIWSE